MSLPTFIRYTEEDKEVLVNVNVISKIEVTFPERDPETGRYYETSLKRGSEHPEGHRVYTLFVGDKPLVTIKAKIGEAVSKLLWEICKNAISYDAENPHQGGNDTTAS